MLFSEPGPNGRTLRKTGISMSTWLMVFWTWSNLRKLTEPEHFRDAESAKPSARLEVENTTTSESPADPDSDASTSVSLSDSRRFCASFREEKMKRRLLAAVQRAASSAIERSEQMAPSVLASSTSDSSARSISAKAMTGRPLFEAP